MPFSKKTFDFLIENRLNNSAQWYGEHKKQAQELVTRPLKQLALALAPSVQQTDPLLITDPARNGTVSRIRRDTRFSKDKTLYRDKMWCGFCRDKKSFDCPPGFFVEITPDGYRFGVGWYQMPPARMQALRRLVLKNGPAFAAARQAVAQGFTLEGDWYKRPRYPDHPQREWLDRRNVCVQQEGNDFALLFSEQFAPFVADQFSALAPVYRFFIKAGEIGEGIPEGK